MGSVINTPLAQVLGPVRGGGEGANLLQQAFTGQQLAQRQAEAQRAADAQRLANLGQASVEGLQIINRDPQNAEENLRDFINQRRQLLPSVGFTDLTDTDDLEAALDEGGVDAAQQLLTSALDAAKSAGFKLPPPTTPSFRGVFTAVDPRTGKPTIFQRSEEGVVLNTGLLAPEKTPLVQVGAGGGEKERTKKFGELFDESKNLDKTLGQITQLRDIVAKGGLGTIGTSGRVAKGFENVASAIGGIARNLGLGADEFDQGSIVSNALAGTPLGEAANKNAKVQSLVTNLAFAVARAQGNQRITDKDFEAAVRTLGASADNPRQLVDVINQFGNTALTQFETDVERTGGAFGFTQQQFDALRNIPSVEPFRAQLGISPASITLDTPLSEITRDQAIELQRSDPELFQQLLERARQEANRG